MKNFVREQMVKSNEFLNQRSKQSSDLVLNNIKQLETQVAEVQKEVDKYKIKMNMSHNLYYGYDNDSSP